jgi:glycine/D-amino acid oxidase-like deaminating enzyme
MHHVIIGNGIVALSTAYRLAQRAGDNDQIIVIGKSSREGSATLAAAAMLNSFAEVEAGSLENEVNFYRFELSHLATQMWPSFEDDIIQSGGSNLPKQCRNCQVLEGGCFDRGTYVVNNVAADDLDDDNYTAILSALKMFNEQHEEVDPRSIPNYEPEQRLRATRALYIHGEGWLNPRLVIEKLEAVLRQFPQVSFVEANADRLTSNQGLISSVILNNDSVVEGDRYLLATGATVSAVLSRSRLGIEVQPIFYGVGTSLEIVSPEYQHTKCIRTPNRGLACGIYSVPYFQGPHLPNDHIIIGATSRISPIPESHTNLSSIESLSRAAMEQINRNFYRAKLFRVNCGWRPTSQDTYPLLGQCSIKNLILATGTKRDGFHLAPLISEMMADLMEGKAIDERMLVFRPERPLLHTLTREQGVDKAVRHTISAWYQHGYNPSKNRMPEIVLANVRDQVERLHDKVGAYDWGIPPEMLDMYRYSHALGGPI